MNRSKGKDFWPFSMLSSSVVQGNRKKPGNSKAGLQSLVEMMPRLEKALTQMRVGLFYIDIKGFKSVEATHGRGVCNQILGAIALSLIQSQIVFYGQRRKLGVCSLVGDDFLVFVDHPEISELDVFGSEFESVHHRMELNINQVLITQGLDFSIGMHVGYVELERQAASEGQTTEYILYQAIKEASMAAKKYQSAREHEELQYLREIISERRIQVLYQPIVSLQSGDVIGCEALSRGPEGTRFEAPLPLFAAARRYHCSVELEKVCTAEAIRSALGVVPRDCQLFLNVNPFLLNSANYRINLLQELLNENNIQPSQVVLELTERTEINDYEKIRQELDFFREEGFMIAIDDAGAGYSSLQAIAELSPDYVKVDISLIREIDINVIKRNLVETLVDLSHRINARIIGEGIERMAELNILCDMGCDMGQGFLLAPPCRVVHGIDHEAYDNIVKNSARRKISMPSLTNRIGDVAVFQIALTPETPVGDLMALFKKEEELNGVAVCRDDAPVGIVMRDRLYAMLSTRYGYDLFSRRPIMEVMESNPLVLPWNVSLEEAARRLAPRLDRGVNDHLIVTRDGKYAGLVTVGKMVEHLARLQIEQAREANPLSGLPGNRSITQRLWDELERPEGPWATIYLDLDNFKAFNDIYGFEHGDRALLMTARIIVQAVADYGNPRDFVGHIGGDDFVIITTRDKAEEIARAVISVFSRDIEGLYDSESLARGYITAESRTGESCRYPIMSISLAGLSGDHGPFSNPLQIGEVAAEVKKKAKSIQGSCYVVNQRHYSQ